MFVCLCIQLIVNLVDMNDNYPTFPLSQYIVQGIAETVAVGTDIIQGLYVSLYLAYGYIRHMQFGTFNHFPSIKPMTHIRETRTSNLYVCHTDLQQDISRASFSHQIERVLFCASFCCEFLIRVSHVSVMVFSILFMHAFNRFMLSVWHGIQIHCLWFYTYFLY